jgi:hypothetical protein
VEASRITTTAPSSGQAFCCFSEAAHSVSSNSSAPPKAGVKPTSQGVAETGPSSRLDELTRQHVAEAIDIEQLLLDLERAAKWNHGAVGKVYNKSLWKPAFARETYEAYHAVLVGWLDTSDSVLDIDTKKRLLSSKTVGRAFKALCKSDYERIELSAKVRSLERFIGKLKQTPLTDELSLRLLAANSRAGNVGRSLSLLQLRKTRGYPPRNREFVYAVQALQSANYANRVSRNYFVGEADQPALDNPTRWLDAILINMAERKYALTLPIANRMLQTYATGKSGKLIHHFYKVVRQSIAALPEDERPASTGKMPQDWFYVPPGLSNESGYSYQPLKVKLKYNTSAPPAYKVPAQARGRLFFSPTDPDNGKFKLERESEPEYSIPLAAAFSFCDSLQQGACGHQPLDLDVGSHNALIKACVHRGALWRAMDVLDTVMPTSGCEPNNISFDLILGGLAAVGDVATAQEYFRKMLNHGLRPDPFTVRAIVDGLLNVGDVAAAVTVVQDFFNQHDVLPPYMTHTKILEFCLARDMIHEAKRYVYFIQQLWYWQPNNYHDERFVDLMRSTQRNTQLQRPALEKLFAYFGEELTDADFL